jgi:hypothetical protein
MHFWSIARSYLRLSDDEFFAMTPRQFDALLKQRKSQVNSKREHFEFMLGQLTSWVANTGFRTAKEQTKATDFMPSEWRKKASNMSSSTRRKRMTKKRRREIASGIRQFFAPTARQVS